MKLSRYFDKIDSKSYPVDFFDIRIEKTSSTNVRFENGLPVGAQERPSLGAFIRIFNRGRWYFSSTTKVTTLHEELQRIISSSLNYPVGDEKFDIPKTYPPYERLLSEGAGFAAVDLPSKIQLLVKYTEALSRIEKVSSSILSYTDIQKRKAYLSSVGTAFEYDFFQGGIFFSATFVDGEARFHDRHAIYSKEFKGFHGRETEFLNYFKDSSRFIHAKAIAPGNWRVVFDSHATGVFTHESFGHKSEADFLLGDPTAIGEWELGKKIGPENLSIVDSGLHEDSSGDCPVDDEGTPAQKNYLVKYGRLAGRLHSQLTAQVFNEPATGNSRSINFEYEPIVRMTSTYIEAGNLSFEELIKKCGNGVFITGVSSGTGGSTFTLVPLRAYLIENGKISEPVRVSLVSGSLFKTLTQIEGISKDLILESGAFGGCGKMEQWPLPVADGGPAIFVSEMQVS